jgi:DNA-binding CsgD family transcriptional regulator
MSYPQSTSLVSALSPFRWGLLAAATTSPIDALEMVRRDLATVGFANVACLHNLPFADQMRFPGEQKIIGTVIHPEHQRMCYGIEATPELRRVGLDGGSAYMRVSEFPLTDRRIDIMRDLGLTSSCAFGAPDRVSRETSVLMANWFEGLEEFERVFPMIRDRLTLGAVFVREGLIVNQLRMDFDGDLLTLRERDCLSWVAAGRSTKAIAGLLHLSPATVNEYIANAITKLRASNRAQACARALLLGLVTP